MTIQAKWKDIVPEGFDLDAVMAQTTHSEQTMRNRLRLCSFDVPLALNDTYWAGNMRRKHKGVMYRGKACPRQRLAAMLGVSVSTISHWFAKGFTPDQVVRGVMNNDVRPDHRDREDGPADWSALGDMGPRVKVGQLPEPTRWDRQYGWEPVNEMDCKI